MVASKKISRRIFVKGSIVIGGLLAAGGTFRAFNTGVFSTGNGPAYEAWKIKYHGLKEIVNSGILAANAHNSQPWLFSIDSLSIDLFTDLTRSIGTIDPYAREMYISLGCALENMKIAAKAEGYLPQITYFPSQENQKHVTRIKLSKAKPDIQDLYDMLKKRHMNRSPYDINQKIPEDAIQSLYNLNSDFEIKLFVFNDPNTMQKIGKAMVEATESIIDDKEQTSDSAQWFRQTWEDIENHKDGITTDSQGLPFYMRVLAKMLPPLSQEQNDQYWLDTLKNKQVKTAAAFGFIAVKDLSDKKQIVNSGELWQRIHLWATANNIGMQIMNQLSERRDRELQLSITPYFGNMLTEIIGSSDWHSVIQFRMGYPTLEALPSPRRPVEEVIIKV